VIKPIDKKKIYENINLVAVEKLSLLNFVWTSKITIIVSYLGGQRENYG